jgi:hypothetical protein
MALKLLPITCMAFAVVGCVHAIGGSAASASWLDDANLTSWNEPAPTLPAPPKMQGHDDPRCRERARPVELEEDRLLRDRGWDLVGAFVGGWQARVIRATAGYDGMCRPRQYQDFVFVRGAFAGTLSPRPMDSRSDGALRRVFVESDRRLMAEYDRYAATDPLCCPSRTTAVVFEIASDPPVLRPLSAASTAKR